MPLGSVGTSRTDGRNLLSPSRSMPTREQLIDLMKSALQSSPMVAEHTAKTADRAKEEPSPSQPQTVGDAVLQTLKENQG